MVGVTVAFTLLVLIGWAAPHKADTAVDREASTLAVLRSIGIQQSGAELDGMGVTVYGPAEDPPVRARAVSEVRDLPGIRVITDQRMIKQASDGETDTTDQHALAHSSDPSKTSHPPVTPDHLPLLDPNR